MFICNHCHYQSIIYRKSLGRPIADKRKGYFQSPLLCSEGSVDKKQASSSSKAGYLNTKVEPFYERGSGSRPIWDLRPVDLKSKAGVENPEVCSQCNGTGETLCALCEGVNYYAKDGSGKVMCPACNDKKYVPCHFCYATGKAIQLKEGWWEEELEKQVRK
ncbi:hypothetical protein GpartN1_g6721.t1 [Galdieria partita]|uniref:Uncharacterized protein n=1 Tax=Galdieria partita TaxID=83374 RepID=A0A9C7Q2N3_9RHOD|nr:hypothetical protein GpartN1_g6721.t1 [Galdieria partita]